MKHLWEVKHPYYCRESNFHVGSREKSFGSYQEWDSWAEFIEEYGKSDLDMNLVFRWDWKKETEPSEWDEPDEWFPRNELWIFFMLQRKGCFRPLCIKNMRDEDEPSVIEFLKPRLAHLIKLWEPLDQL